MPPGAEGDTFVMFGQIHTIILIFSHTIQELQTHCVRRLTAKSEDLIVCRVSKADYLNNYLPSTSCFVLAIK